MKGFGTWTDGANFAKAERAPEGVRVTHWTKGIDCIFSYTLSVTDWEMLDFPTWKKVAEDECTN